MNKSSSPAAPQLPCVRDYDDYRAFLRDHYEARKAVKRLFSYRFMASRLNVDAGQLAWILKGKLHLPERAVGAAIQLCHLEGRDAAYFEELVHRAHARSEGERTRSGLRLAALRGVETVPVEPEASAYYEKFHHSVLRALAPLEPALSPEMLGTHCRPELPAATARASLKLLEDLALLKRGPEGWTQPHPHLVPGSGIRPEVLRGFHAQAIRQAGNAFQLTPPEERDISLLTAGLEAADFPKVCEWIAELRHEAQVIAEETSSPDRVVQLNVQFFPLASRHRSAGR